MNLNQISTSHYIRNATMMKEPTYDKLKSRDQDADYNIRSGVTFGATQTETIEKQGWRSK